MDNTVNINTQFAQPEPKTYTIDKAVPIPNITMNKKGRWDPVVEAMQIGDSIAFSNRKESDQLLSALRNRGFKNCVRKEGPHSFRVWKLESFK
jgi:S-formylglutathione hydrolase FrmB